MNVNLKRIMSLFILSIYFCFEVFHGLIFFGPSIANAQTTTEKTIPKTDLVAVLVDSSIYGNLSDEIKWYTTEYIQRHPNNKNTNTQAIVLEVNTDNLYANDIVKILENLYFDGLKDKPSELIGTVLIGDIPMPVINQDGFIFPSIFPYTDFEKQKYIWDFDSNYFVLNDKGKSQSEIWHGLINYNNDDDYKNFFSKLKNYIDDPSEFVDRSIWYEDFIANQSYYYEEALNSYLNNFLFTEDLGYKRYTQLMLDIMQGKNNEQIQEALAGLPDFADFDLSDIGGNSSSTKMIEQSITEGYLKNYFDLTSPKQKTRIVENLEEANRWNKEVENIFDGTTSTIPTWDSHQEKVFMKDEFILRNDSQLSNFFVDLNNLLEVSLKDKVEQEKYYMNEVLPLTYLLYEKGEVGIKVLGVGKESDVWKKYEAYDNFYFGDNAKNITNAEQTSIYRGTRRNLDSLDNIDIDTIQNSNNPASDIDDLDLSKRSIGSSYDIFSTQVEANRGYNYLNANEEAAYYNTNKISGIDKWKIQCDDWWFNNTFKIYCESYRLVLKGGDQNKCEIGNIEKQGGCETLSEFSMRMWGGASSLNLDNIENGTWKEEYNYKDARNPIFDIAGSKAVSEDTTQTNDFQSIQKYTNMIKMRFADFGGGASRSSSSPDKVGSGYIDTYGNPSYFTNYKPTGSLDNPTWVRDEPLSFGSVDYFSKYDNASDRTKEGNIIKLKDSNEVWTYKTVDSRVYNDSSNTDELSSDSINITTQSRPIDSPRYMTFKGVGGDVVKLIYPNIFKVEVFKDKAEGELELKSVDEIKSSIENYLRQVARKYNEYLTEQNSKKQTLYATYKEEFDLLAQLDVYASPVSSRNYKLLEEDFFIEELRNKLAQAPLLQNQMGDYTDPIDFVAYMLYYQNVGWKDKLYSENIQEDLDLSIDSFDINNKIEHVLDLYLSENKEFGEGYLGEYITPDYQKKGYEVGFFNSQGTDLIKDENIPSFVAAIEAKIAAYEDWQKAKDNNDISDNNDYDFVSQEIQEECGLNQGGELILDISDMSSPWLKAFQCWLEKTLEKPFELSISRNSNIAEGAIVDDFASMMTGIGMGFVEDLSDAGLEYLGVDEWDELKKLEGWKTVSNKWNILNVEQNNEAALAQMDKETANKLQGLLSYIQIELDPTSVNIDDTNTTLNIYSAKDFGSFDFYFNATGENQLILEETNISNTEYKTNFNPSTAKQFGINLIEKDILIGYDVIGIDICIDDACVSKSLKFNVIPGKLQNIKLGDDISMLKNQFTIFDIEASDRFGNNVGYLTDQSFEVSTKNGKIGTNSPISSSLTMFDFRDPKVYYQASNNPGIDIVKIEDTLDPSVNDEMKVNVVDGKLNFEFEGSAWEHTENGKVEFGLEDVGTLTYVDDNGVAQVDKNKFPKISIKLLDQKNNLVKMDTDIYINTISNLGVFGTIDVEKDSKGVEKTRFNKKSMVSLKDGELDLYFLPNYNAGSMDVQFIIPGALSNITNINVLAGKSAVVDIQSRYNSIQVGENAIAKAYVYDTRGNKTDSDDLSLGVIGDINLKSTSKTNDGGIVLNLESNDKAGVGYIYGTIKSGADNIRPDYHRIYVDKSLIPEKDLNVMYLNLFGNDWGNQWGYFSSNNSKVEEIMSNSEKTIITTTQLIDPESLRSFDLSIGKKGINTQAPFDTLIQNGQVVLQVDKIGSIGLNDLQVKSYNNLSDINNNTSDSILYYKANQLDSNINVNSIKDNKLIVNNDIILDLDKNIISPLLDISNSGEIEQGYTIYNVYFDNLKIGEMIFSINPDNVSLDLLSNFYSTNTWQNGSTNYKAIGIYQNIDGGLQYKKSFTSIEDSKDPTIGIGFSSSFRNITNFGQGLNVGDASKSFASEFLINLGDPLVSMIDENITLKNAKIDTETKEIDEIDLGYDLGIGKNIFNSNVSISEVLDIDFNNDELLDLVVVLEDGSIRLLKNYGGEQNYTDLGELLKIAVGIKDVQIGDIDGNGYQDIIITTRNGYLRAYTNNGGIFDVDGYPICLNTNVREGAISKSPQNVSDVVQIFTKDMDMDGALDIVTNDKLGFIKIFYGGNGLISTNKYLCDNQWYDRQEKDTNTVTRFGVQINEEDEIRDSSLVSRKGLSKDDIDNIMDNFDIKEDIGIDTSLVDNIEDYDFENNGADGLMGALNNAMGYDMGTALDKFTAEYDRLIDDPIGMTPAYQDSDEPIKYMQIANVGKKDEHPINIYKKYDNLSGDNVLNDGDQVQISVHIEAKEDFEGTLIDYIKGPWKLDVRNDGSFSNWWFDEDTVDQDKIDNELKVKWNANYSYYVLDNILLKKGEKIIINYILEYKQQDTNVVMIDIEDIDGTKYVDHNIKYKKDKLPDIKVQASDACLKAQIIFWNTNKTNKRDYDEQFVNLAEILMADQNGKQEAIDNAMNENNSNIIDMVNNVDVDGLLGNDLTQESSLLNADMAALTGFLNELWEDEFYGKTILEGLGDISGGDTYNELLNVWGGLETDIDLDSVISKLTNNGIESVQDLTESLCQGLSLEGGNSCEGLPIPFNQGFMAPGQYHMFGCYEITPLSETLGKGRPVLNFPGNWGPILGAYIPAPGIFGLPARGPGDGFLGGPQIGTYPSMLRMYLVPTLTAQMGIAICGGPYQVGMNIPSPVSDIGGNCVVVSVALPCGDGGGAGNSMIDGNIGGILNDLDGIGICNRPAETQSNPTPWQITKGSNDAPFVPKDADYLFGYIDMDVNPIFENSYDKSNNESGVYFDGVPLIGGTNTSNKITDGNSKGFMQKIVKDWMDRQVNYILNNFTRMDLDIYLPEMSGLLKGFDTIQWPESKELTKEDKCVNNGKIYNTQTGKCDPNPKLNNLGVLDNFLQSNWISRNQVQNFDENSGAMRNVVNVSEKLEEAFSEVELVNIRSENINIKIPIISNDDIDAYILSSEKWIEDQEKILEQWNNIIKTIYNEENIELKQDIKQLEEQAKQITDPIEKEKIEKQIKTLEDKSTSITNPEVLKEFIDFNHNANELIITVRRNILVLQEYKKFPNELKEWINVSDTYMNEMSLMLENFVGTLSMWMKTNATRISQYVDAINSIVNVLSTYNLIVNFSNQWSERCGSCTNDTYDMYSCKLSFLCPDVGLPVLPIPPFKLPNIIVDLSDIQLGIDIKLPKFNFVPQNIVLPKLPDLPTPPLVDFNIDLNTSANLEFILEKFILMGKYGELNIPVGATIPNPPSLPPLPSFIPSIQMSLPLMPHPPKIPEIPNEIKASIEVAENIGKILCIVKGGIGLVGESSIKARVEQMTQRQYDVPMRDQFDFTPQWLQDAGSWIEGTQNSEFVDAPLMGVDLLISSHVDIQFPADQVYAFVNAAVQEINSFSEGISNTASNTHNDVSNTLDNLVDDNLDIDDVVVDFDLDLTQVLEKTEQELQKAQEDTNSYLNTQSKNLQGQIKDPMAVNIEDIVFDVNYVDYDANVIKDTNDNLREALIAMNELSDSYSLKTASNEVLNNLDHNNEIQANNKELYEIYQGSNKVINDVKDSNKELIYQVENDYSTFQNNVAQNTTTLVNSDVNVSFNFDLFDFGNNKGDTETNKQTPKMFENQIAQANTTNNINTNSTSTNTSDDETIQSDITAYINGVYIQDDNNVSYNIVKSDRHSENVIEYKELDLNNDEQIDMLMRDRNNVFVKIRDNDDEKTSGGYTSKYMHYAINDINTLMNSADIMGYVKVAGDSIKIYSNNTEVKNLEVAGQSFDNLSISWNNMDQSNNETEGYLIKLSNRVDYWFDKETVNNKDVNKLINSKYLLILPEGTEYANSKIILEDGLVNNISSLQENGDIVEISFYKNSLDTLNTTISEINRERNYMKIYGLDFYDNKYIINTSSSNQILAGKQILANTTGPDINVEINRIKTDGKIEGFLSFDMFVGTYYDIIVNISDTTQLKYIEIKNEDGETVAKKESNKIVDKIVIEDVFFEDDGTYEYNIFANNIDGISNSEDIMLNVKNPEISINDIVGLRPYEKYINMDSIPVSIIAELDQDIDEGIVNFGNRYNDRWNILKGSFDTKGDNYVDTLQTLITGGIYEYSNNLALFNKDNTQIASINPSNGKIIVLSKYIDDVDLLAHFTNKGMRVIVDNNGVEQFEIEIPSDELVNIEPGNMEILDLDSKELGDFYGGKALKYNGNIYLYVNSQGQVIANEELYGYYEFDKNSQTIKYYFEDKDLGIQKGYIEVKAKNFMADVLAR